jgi:hypothetical protein
MNAKSALNVFAWINLVLGIIALLGSISISEVNFLTYLIELVLIGTGIILLTKPIGTLASVFFGISFGIFVLFVLVGLFFPTDASIALILLLMGGAPLVFASIYLIKLKSEKSLEKVPSGTSDFDSIDLEEKKLKAYDIGLRYFNEKEFDLALKMFEKIRDFRDSEHYILEIKTILLEEEKDRYRSKK